ncbi:hypothetical protein RHG98_03665 [Thermosynechococcus sp. PP22]|uniref:hypothetical protein n=1 Tax=Thermosynechococcus sp. PP22 TaxID=3074082 RepID=UPI002872EC2F|nr:hypothetical protein [Thermosynechococcus sp. PP22]WNC22969.1 hypothetical protein RHG98_03665 [Thermosynechococcus sp. PP22]
MQESIAQDINLVLWGNAVLGAIAADNPSREELEFPQPATFLDLRKEDSSWRQMPYAPDPMTWLERLRGEGAEALQLLYEASQNSEIPDRIAIVFPGGGGHWLVEVVKSTGCDYWRSRWRWSERDQRWEVAYGRILCNHPRLASPMRTIPPDTIRAELLTHLDRMTEFAANHDQETFARTFDLTRQMLNSCGSLTGEERPWPVSRLAELCQQLLSAVEVAWVFGGMGSWNDLTFSGDSQTEYETLSDTLYQLLNTAIVVAVNSSAIAPVS